MSDCDDYVKFVTKTVQKHINHYYSIQGRDIDDLTGLYCSKKVEALKTLANDLGVLIE